MNITEILRAAAETGSATITDIDGRTATLPLLAAARLYAALADDDRALRPTETRPEHLLVYKIEEADDSGATLRMSNNCRYLACDMEFRKLCSVDGCDADRIGDSQYTNVCPDHADRELTVLLGGRPVQYGDDSRTARMGIWEAQVERAENMARVERRWYEQAAARIAGN